MDTGGTMCKAAELIKENGAASVRAICTHALFSGSALDKIENSALDKVIVTDTIPLKRLSDKVEVLSVAEVFADVIRSVMDNTSIRAHFKMNIS
jgi:ribose-phosphate pyrophosphokinase